MIIKYSIVKTIHLYLPYIYIPYKKILGVQEGLFNVHTHIVTLQHAIHKWTQFLGQTVNIQNDLMMNKVYVICLREDLKKYEILIRMIYNNITMF